jgi:plastin-1
VSKDRKSRIRKITNANYILELGAAMNLTLVNIGPTDLVDGNKKLMLAMMWQLTRK